MKLLLSWIGTTDLEGKGYEGPIYDILKDIPMEKAIFLSHKIKSRDISSTGNIIPNLKKLYPKLHVITKSVTIEWCNDLPNIYNLTESILKNNYKSEVYINIHSGSKIMVACWLLAVERLPKDIRQPIFLQPSLNMGLIKSTLP